MSDTLSFPGLGLEFDVNPVVVQITDTWAIKWYGVIIAVAFLLGATYIFRRVKDFGLDSDRVIDVLLGGVLGGILGARLYYVIFSWDTYRANPAAIIRIWEGGIAIYGGIIGGVLVGMAICKIRKVKFLPMLDLAVGGLLLGQAIGRWGNFINMEAFGSNTTLPWGMTSRTIANYLTYHQSALERIGVTVDPFMPVHPTFFYESLWCLIGFGLMAWYTNKRRFDGELALLYIGWYGLGRFVIEGLRTDSLLLGTMRVSQLLAIACVVVAVVVLLLIRSKIKRENDPDYLPLYVDTDEGRAILAGTFYKKEDKASQAAVEEAAPVTGETAAGQPESEPVPDEAEQTRPQRDPVAEEAPE